ncbi:MAG: hypothetical protein AAF497_16230 [Planctomycetota bacterium]
MENLNDKQTFEFMTAGTCEIPAFPTVGILNAAGSHTTLGDEAPTISIITEDGYSEWVVLLSDVVAIFVPNTPGSAEGNRKVFAVHSPNHKQQVIDFLQSIRDLTNKEDVKGHIFVNETASVHRTLKLSGTASELARPAGCCE